MLVIHKMRVVNHESAKLVSGATVVVWTAKVL